MRAEANARQAALETSVAELSRRVTHLDRELEFTKNRQASYLGNGVAMTWLADETIIYVNSNDEGCPANFLSGGLYEEENMDVFLSFLRPDSLVLDIGANLGVFSLRTAQKFNKTDGRIMSFEPHPDLWRLFRRSIEHNGFLRRIEALNLALADRNGEIELFYESHHLGGGGQSTGNPWAKPVKARLQILDELLPTQIVDLVKLDVEGNELSVLNGMQKLVERSLDIAILFEKLGPNSPIDDGLFDYFETIGMGVYVVYGTGQLDLVDRARFKSLGAYFIAARQHRIGNSLDRRFVEIGWRQLSFQDGLDFEPGAPSRPVEAEQPDILFHGPYWHLRKGRYELEVVTERDDDIQITVAERFGNSVAEILLPASQKAIEFETAYDLHKFEIVARAVKPGKTRIAVSHLTLRRLSN